MKLEEFAAVLRSATRPLDGAVLMEQATKIVQRATALASGTVTIHVTRTPSGIRFSAVPPTERARRALQRAVDEQMPAIQEMVAAEGRERLRRG